MYATMFHIELRAITSPRERSRLGRSLGQTLGSLGGFVAFVAIEAEGGDVSGLFICEDQATLDAAQILAERWQTEHSDIAGGGIQPISAGKVIVQQGL